MPEPEVPEMDDEVERLMEVIRESHYLTTDVSRERSLELLLHLSGRINDLAGEIAHEISKYER